MLLYDSTNTAKFNMTNNNNGNNRTEYDVNKSEVCVIVLFCMLKGLCDVHDSTRILKLNSINNRTGNSNVDTVNVLNDNAEICVANGNNSMQFKGNVDTKFISRKLNVWEIIIVTACIDIAIIRNV